jgi:hypothetical protein
MHTTEKILAVLDRNFTPDINVIYERTVFNNTIQEGEKSEEFVNNLRKKIKYCNYGAIENELLRDRIVVGCRDNELKKSFYQTKELEQAIDSLKAYEAAIDRINQQTTFVIHKSPEIDEEIHKIYHRGTSNGYSASTSKGYASNRYKKQSRSMIAEIVSQFTDREVVQHSTKTADNMVR